ncbi:MAG: hypothetical protein ACRCZO_12620, partial [Cetobacterium sp.]
MDEYKTQAENTDECSAHGHKSQNSQTSDLSSSCNVVPSLSPPHENSYDLENNTEADFFCDSGTLSDPGSIQPNADSDSSR